MPLMRPICRALRRGRGYFHVRPHGSGEGGARNFPVPQEVLADEGQAQAIVDRLISQNWARAVESYIVAGNPSLTGTGSLTGITQIAEVASGDASSYANGVDAIAAGVESIQTGGWYGPHVVAAAPSTLDRIDAR